MTSEDHDIENDEANDEAIPTDPSSVSRDVWADIGDALAKARVTRGMSKREAAAAVKVSDATWRWYEDGGRDMRGTWMLPNPKRKTRDRIADEFGVVIIFNEDEDDIGQWEFNVREPTPVPDRAAAGGADPSHLTGAIADLNETVREVRDELRYLRAERGEGTRGVEPMENSSG